MPTNYSVECYRPELRKEWDAFVRESRNGTFLFERDYMDYHSDRFIDFSLIVRNAKGSIMALLPANRDNDGLVSHAGLTYGGFVIDGTMRASRMLEVFGSSREFLVASGIREWTYKPVPHIYHREPSEEDLYALFRCGAALIRREVGACGCPAEVGRFPEMLRRWRKAEKACLTVGESERFQVFWPLLEENLGARHNARPVHSLEEIRLLKARFPDQIRLFLVQAEDVSVAGVVVYETPTVAHVQYAAATQEGRSLGAMYLLIAELLHTHFGRKRWFDYGISTEDEGRVLNAGLQEFKEGFGLRAVASDWYRMLLA